MDDGQRDWIGLYILGTNYPYRELNFLAKFIRIFWYALKRFHADQIAQRAVALTYYTLFAIVPVAALSFGIAKGFELEGRLHTMLAEQFSHQREVLNWISRFAYTTLAQTHGSLVAGVGVFALFWTVVWLSSNIESAFNAVWLLPKRRNIFRRLSDYLAILMVMPIVLVILGSAGPVLRKMFNLLLAEFPLVAKWGGGFFWFGIEFFPIVLVSVIFSLIYLLAPNTKVKFMSALCAGIVAGVFFQLLQDGFLYLQSSIFRYNKIYGTFAVLPLFLIWLQWSWQITLLGAEFSFVRQNIGSGFFDRTRDELLSQRLRREYEIALARRVYRNFAAGQGSTPAAELLREIPLPPVTALALLNELCDAEVLCRVRNSNGNTPGEACSFVPGRPTETMRIHDAEKLLDRVGIDHLSSRTGMEEVSQVVEDLDTARDKSPYNRLLKEL